MTLRRFRPMRGPLGIAGFRRCAAAASAFSPLDLSPRLWIDPSDGTTVTKTGNQIDQINDLTGNGLHVTGDANAPDHGTDTINSLDAIDFATAGEFLTLANNTIPSGDQTFWFAAVVKVRTAGADRSVIGYGTNATNQAFTFKFKNSTTKWQWGAYGGASYPTVVPSFVNAVVGTTFFVEIWYDSVASTGGLRVDGVEVPGITISGDFNLGQTVRYLGLDTGGANGFVGTMGEIMLKTDEVPSVATLEANLYTYIFDKWACPGLTDLSTIFAYRYEADRLSTLWTTSAKSTNVTADNDPIGAWSDIDGTSDFAQTTSTLRGYYDLDYRGVRGDNVDDYFTRTITAGAAKTILVVVDYGAGSAGGDHLTMAQNNSRLYHTQPANFSAFYTKNEAAGVETISTGLTGRHILALRFVSASSAFYSIDGGTETEFDPHDDFSTATTQSLLARLDGTSPSDVPILAVYQDDTNIGTTALATAVATAKARFAV